MLEKLVDDVIAYRHMIQYSMNALGGYIGVKHHHHSFTRERSRPLTLHY